MKIAYLSETNPDGPFFDQLFLTKMVERGYEPYLITFWPGKTEELASFRVEGVRLIHKPFPKRSHSYGSRRWPLMIAAYLRWLLWRIKPDVLHTGWVLTTGYYGALSGFHPMLLMPWGHDILTDPSRLQIFQSEYFKRRTELAIRRADMITCDCELVKKRIVEMSSYPVDKIVVFPWGVDQGIFYPRGDYSSIRFKLGWEKNKILIITRNFTSLRYGVQYFIDALPSIIQQEPEVRVILVGYGPLRETYERMITDLGLQEHVFFTGRISNLEMSDYLKAADMYVTTSFSDGTSVSLLEAISCGLPVVVSDAPANLEWVQDGFNGYIVPREDSVVLAERIVCLLSDEIMLRKMAQRNLDLARECANWERNFDVLEGIYTRLVSD